MLVCSLFLLLSKALCSLLDDPARKLDRLMVYHRFDEAIKLIDSSPDMPQKVCTSQVISRCIHLRNYKEAEAWRLPRGTPATRSFINALHGDEVTCEPFEIRLEANLIFELVLPHAIGNQEIITRALNMAVFHSDYDLIDRLISFEWDKFGEDEDGITPLMMAVRHNRRAVFCHLYEKGADIHYINKYGENLVHFWARKVDSDHAISVYIYELILYNRLDCESKSFSGFTPLQIAAGKQNNNVLRYLQQICQ